MKHLLHAFVLVLLIATATLGQTSSKEIVFQTTNPSTCSKSQMVYNRTDGSWWGHNGGSGSGCVQVNGVGGGGANATLSNLGTTAVNSALLPAANDSAALGSTAKGWSDLFLATGAVLNFANGNAVITHSSGVITVSVGDLRLTTSGNNATSAVTVGGTQTLTSKTIDGDNNTVQDLPYSAIKSDSRSGNGTKLATVTGVLTSGNCVEIDASGNLVDAGDPCGTGGGGGTPGGSTTQVQINVSGAFAGDAGLTFNTATDVLTIGAAVVVSGTGAGYIEMTEGVAPSTVANAFQILPPTDITGALSYVLPGTGTTGFMLATNSGGTMTISHVASTGTSDVVRSTSPTFATNFTLASGTAPTTTSVAQMAFDTNAQGTGRGSVQVNDGTANTYLVGILASDTCTNGQVPVWNTGGTWTCETQSGGSGTPGGLDTELQINSSGTFAGVTGATSNGTTVTFASAALLATRPKITTSIDDANGNEVIKTPATASAVNEITVTNSATGNPVSVTATGGDTNIGVIVAGKGTGGVQLGATGATDSYVDLLASAAPSTPAAGLGTLHVDSSDKVLVLTDDDGNTSTTVRAEAGAANNFLTAIGANGVPAKAQPTWGNLAAGTGTNLTLDAEGTGNVITAPYFIEFLAAGTSDGSAGAPYLDLPSSNKPAAAVIAGTNTLYAVLDFDAATDESAQGSFQLPDDFSGAIDFALEWQAAATSGSVVWALQTACVADDEANDPSWNTAQTVTDAAKGTANRRNTASISSVTQTGCAAGERFHFKFYRDADNGSDDMTGDARLKAIRFKIRRTM